MKNLSDLNMPNTQISSIRNAVAERMAHGLNAREIQAEMPKLTKPQLIRVIMDLLVNPNTDDSIIEPQKLSANQGATIDINLIASKMTMANISSTEDNWTNTLMDILEEEYNIETQVRIKMFGN